MSKRRVELEPASESTPIAEAFAAAKVARLYENGLVEALEPPAAPAASVRTSARVLRKKEERKLDPLFLLIHYLYLLRGGDHPGGGTLWVGHKRGHFRGKVPSGELRSNEQRELAGVVGYPAR